ncbi:MAG: hypothetical protein I4O51_10215 [Flavobacterium micromati]|nr:hypothetical protein [Flavobacterium micromati]
MKKIITLFLLFTNIALLAQASQGFNYQGTVRNSNGQLIINQSVIFKFVLMQNSATGQVIYSETHSVITDDLGGASLIIGTGSPLTGSFSLINWASGTYYMGIELNTGNGFIAMGITQLLSVPYALYSLDSGSTKKTSILLTGNITDAEAAAKLALEVGPDTNNIFIIGTTALTTVDLSSISTVISLKIMDNTKLTFVNLNGLIGSFGSSFIIMKNPLLASLSFPSCKFMFSDFNVGFNALPSPVINTILHQMLTIKPLNNKYIMMKNQNPVAPPTGQGVIDYDTLINKGNSVYTD